jgi:membrane protein YdbS with pleckstrin-like domain
MSGDSKARRHWFIIMAVRLIGVAGALFGVVLASRGVAWPHKALGVAIIFSALGMIAIVPAGLAHRWRSGGE